MAPDYESLAERIRHGDRTAETELVRCFGPRIRALAMARGYTADAARDVTQDALIAVLCAVRDGKLERNASLAAFAYGTARNLIHAGIRQRLRLREDPLSEEMVVALSEDEFQRAEQVRRAVSAIRTLPREDRDLLLAILVEGKKPGEIARQMGLSADVVRTRKSRALKKTVAAVSKVLRKAPGSPLIRRES